MAYPTGTFTAAELAVFEPEVWGSQINDFFKCKLNLAAFFTDRSDEVRDGGDVLHTPNMSEMTANVKTNGAFVTLNSPTETEVQLTINSWYEVSFAIEDAEAAQVKRSYRLQERYAKNAAYTVARVLENEIAKLFSTFTTSVGASTTNLADSTLREAISTLDTNCIDIEATDELAFVFHPNTFWRQYMAADKFSLSINTGDVNNPTRMPSYRIYGIRVISSNLVPTISGGNGRYNGLFHMDSIHWASAPLPVRSESGYIGDSNVRVQTQYRQELLAELTTSDIYFGVVKNRDNAGVRMLTHATNA